MEGFFAKHDKGRATYPRREKLLEIIPCLYAIRINFTVREYSVLINKWQYIILFFTCYRGPHAGNGLSTTEHPRIASPARMQVCSGLLISSKFWNEGGITYVNYLKSISIISSFMYGALSFRIVGLRSIRIPS